MRVGHATHFLTRLERLPSQLTDFALALYRNPDLVRFTLQQSGLPERAERVAIALEDRPNGPHIIVARDGGFVTCLGADMSVGDRPVLTRGRLDHLCRRFDRLEAAFALAHDRRETLRLYRNMIRDGHTLTREDFAALEVLVPLAENDFIKTIQDMATDVTKRQVGYRPSRYRRCNKITTEELRDFWMVVHAMGNLVTLCGTRGRELGKHGFPDEKTRAEMQFSLNAVTVWTAVPTVTLQGAWAAARAGRPLLAQYRHSLHLAESILEVAGAGLLLTAAALRHRGMRGEARKLLERTQRRFAGEKPDPHDATLCHHLLQACRDLLEPGGEDRADARRRAIGRKCAMYVSQKQSEEHPYHFAAAEDVPDDIADYMVFRLSGHLMRRRSAASAMVTTLPWLARATATDLYPPERWRDGDIRTWQPKDSRYYLEAVHWYYDHMPPARAEDRPGRNQPCPCGSGKKFKRCCIDADTSTDNTSTDMSHA